MDAPSRNQPAMSYVENELHCLKNTMASMADIAPNVPMIYKTSDIGGTFVQKVHEHGQEVLERSEDNDENQGPISAVINQVKDFAGSTIDVVSKALGLRKSEISDPTEALHDVNDLFQHSLDDFAARQDRLNLKQRVRCQGELRDINKLASRAMERLSKLQDPKNNPAYEKQCERFASLCARLNRTSDFNLELATIAKVTEFPRTTNPIAEITEILNMLDKPENNDPNWGKLQLIKQNDSTKLIVDDALLESCNEMIKLTKKDMLKNMGLTVGQAILITRNKENKLQIVTIGRIPKF